MIRNRCTHLFLFLILTCGLLSLLNAQEAQPPRGLMPNTDQLGSSIDNIDVVSGKLHLQIPLASIPNGNGGLGFNLNLEYDSNLYDNAARSAFWWQYTPQLPSAQTRSGGWTYNSGNYQLFLEGLPPYCVDADGVSGGYVRLNLVLPDGSSHILHRGADDDGKSSRSPDGKDTTCDHSPALSGLLTYFTADGSYLKAETTANQSNWYVQDWTLYYPDGRHVTISPTTGITKLYDANDNWISIQNNCYDPYPGDCSMPYTEIKNSSLGHAIKINYNVTDASMPSGWIQDDIIAPGPNGDITTQIDWRPMTIVAQYDGNGDQNPPVTIGPFQFYVPRYIQLPLGTHVALGSEPPDWNSYEFDYRDNSNSDHYGYGELKYLRTPTGSEYKYDYLYTNNNDRSDPSNVDLWHFYHNAIVDKSIIHDYITDLHWTFSYPNATTTTVANPDGGHVVSQYYDRTASWNWNSGLVYSIENRSNTGASLSLRTRTWAQNVISDLSSYSSKATPKNPFIQQETLTVYGSSPRTAVTNFTYDVNGNMLSKAEYDWNETGGALLRNTVSEYFLTNFSSNGYLNAYWKPHSPAIWNTNPSWTRRLNAVQRMTVSSGSGPAAATEFTYDNAYTNGNVLSEAKWDSVKASSLPALGGLSSSNSRVLSHSYDSHGNLTDSYEPASANDPTRQTHITYDSLGNVYQTYRGYLSNAQRTTEYSWYNNGAALHTKTDSDNNFTTTYQYDNIGRQILADEGGQRKTTTSYDDIYRTVTVANSNRTYDNMMLPTITSYDQLGRAILKQEADGVKVGTSYSYQPGGPRVITSTPYRNTSEASLQWKCTQSDTLGRVTAVGMFKGSTPPTDCVSITSSTTGITWTAYDADWTTVTDPAGKMRRLRKDGLGRVVEVVEDPSGLNSSTTYTYDPLGNLLTVTQGSQEQRSFSYSSLGRLMSAHNPESGTTTYTYYDSGDLATHTDSRGNTKKSMMTYDVLHRILTKSYNDNPTTPNVTYTYYLAGTDPAPNIGQLKSVSTSVASTTYTYNQLGMVLGSTQTITGYSGGSLTFSYEWYPSGALYRIQYPSGRWIYNDVDDAGRTNKVYSSVKPYADLTTSAVPNPFAADGRIAQMKLGNGLYETRNYSAPGSPTIYRLGDSLGSGSRTQLEYNFSGTQNNGNLASQVIIRPGGNWTQNFSYDGINRLSAGYEVGGYNRTYGYDRWGNRYVSSSTGLAHPDTSEPTSSGDFNTKNQLRTSPGVYNYDTAGNQLTYGAFTLGYDAENRNTTVSGSDSMTYSYDGDGRRVKKVWTPAGGTIVITYYVYDALGQLAAEYSSQAPANTGTSYIFSDMLDSARTITSDSKTVTECYDYLPFGRMLSSSDNARSSIGCYPAAPDTQITSGIDQKFTGKERDAETGLDYFGARYYSSPQGRFITPDPLLTSAEISNPQSWNRYSYVQNNPLIYIDPLGLFIWDSSAGGSLTTPQIEQLILTTNDLIYKSELERWLAFRKKFLRAWGASAYMQLIYGIEGIDNGVVIGMYTGALLSVIAPSVSWSQGQISVRKFIFFREDISGQDLNMEGAHEASHVEDYNTGAKMINSGIQSSIWQALYYTHYNSEMKAYRQSVFAADHLNNMANYTLQINIKGNTEYYTIWKRSWSAAQKEDDYKEVLRQYLIRSPLYNNDLNKSIFSDK
jgi:RHS repeat-associated protein